jgi:trehalose 6-phosphate phosphatase
MPPSLHAASALFLDVDGTLIPFAARPHLVVVPEWVVPTLAAVRDGLQGALAIVSGRPLSEIDTLLTPLTLPAAGAHGAERRDGQGKVERRAEPVPQRVLSCARRMAADHPQLTLEVKPGGLALHFRSDPRLGDTCRATLAQALASTPEARLDWEMIDGHFVCELKLRGVSKGVAVEGFLAEPIFSRRVPVFVGDDLTDEDGIRAVQAAGGFGIRVGAGPTEAHYRLADVDAVADWLRGAQHTTRLQHTQRGEP